MKCVCGFEFETRAGHFRNCNMYLNEKQKWVMICPKCQLTYG